MNSSRKNLQLFNHLFNRRASRLISNAIVAVGSYIFLSSCGSVTALKAQLSNEKSQKETISPQELPQKDSLDRGEGLNLTLPAGVAEDKSAPLRITPAEKELLDQSRNDKAIQFTCDKDTGSTKGFVYMALYKGDDPRGPVESWIQEFSFKDQPNQLGTPVKYTVTSFSVCRKPTPGYPAIGCFSGDIFDKFKPDDRVLTWITKVEGYGILVPYTCDKTAKIFLSAPTAFTPIVNHVQNKDPNSVEATSNAPTSSRNYKFYVYTRIYTPSGKATHEALSNAFSDTAPKIELNLKPIVPAPEKIEVVIKNP